MIFFNDIVKQMPTLLDKLGSMSFVTREYARKKLPKEGIYVFYENSRPIYVGRSKNIANRILNHSRPSSGHNSASFAFLLAKEKAQKNGVDVNATRGNLENNPTFSKLYFEAKERVAKMKIKAVEINDHETQAIFEIYASKKLNTQYNNFATH